MEMWIVMTALLELRMEMIRRNPISRIRTVHSTRKTVSVGTVN